jgi:hypothetical protein
LPHCLAARWDYYLIHRWRSAASTTSNRRMV